MDTANRARDRPVLFLFLLRRGLSEMVQLALFTSQWKVYRYGSVLICEEVWFDHNGYIFDITFFYIYGS